MEVKTEKQLHLNNSFFDRYQEYVGEFVYGGIDGCVTTFAVVAGAAGANLDASIVIILGMANLIADGFSMSVGSYLSNKSEKDNYEKHKKIEYWEVENMPETEKEEIRDIYRQKGFEGELLEEIVKVITSKKDRWVDVMMKDELEMIPVSKPPVAMALVTFISFNMVGFIPLSIYLGDYLFGLQFENLFLTSCVLTTFAFAIIGWLKAHVTHTNIFKAIVETLLLGGLAAFLAYFVGDVLEKMIMV